MATDNLTIEIIKKILSNVGIVKEYFGKGLTSKSFLLDKVVNISYDFGNVKHPVYAAQLKIDSFSLRAIFIDLSIDSDEFIFAFRVGDHHPNVIYYSQQDDSYIRIFDGDKIINPSFEMKAKILASFEKVVDYGVLWQDCLEIKDLYDLVIEKIIV